MQNTAELQPGCGEIDFALPSGNRATSWQFNGKHKLQDWTNDPARLGVSQSLAYAQPADKQSTLKEEKEVDLWVL